MTPSMTPSPNPSPNPTGRTPAANTPIGDASQGAVPASKTITKRDLIEQIAERTGQPRAHVKATLQHCLDIIIDELAAGKRIEFRDFGVFEIRDRAARMAQNPRTLERVPVPAKRSVKFKVGRMMQKRVEGGHKPASSAKSPVAGDSDALPQINVKASLNAPTAVGRKTNKPAS